MNNFSKELKFRVWHNAKKEWIHGPGHEVNLFGETILLGGFMRIPIEELNDCMAFQFTGLYDKTGKEIYIGDILDADRFDKLNGPRRGYIDIKWSAMRYDFYLWPRVEKIMDYEGSPIYGKLYEPSFISFGSKGMTVIGNILENPDIPEMSEKVMYGD